MKKLTLGFVLAVSLVAAAQAPAGPGQQTQPPSPDQQQHGEGRGRGMGFGGGIGGTIQSVNADSLTLAMRDGGTATVKITPDTRFVRDGQPVKLSDFKAGDRVLIRGEAAGENTWKADMVITPRMNGAAGEGGMRGEGGPEGPAMERMRDALGKKFIVGEVKSIDGTRLTVQGPDGKDYVAEVDENTSFHKGRESITFPDIKVGDRVVGQGKLNSAGVFVPESLNVGGYKGGRPPQQSQQPAPPQKP